MRKSRSTVCGSAFSPCIIWSRRSAYGGASRSDSWCALAGAERCGSPGCAKLRLHLRKLRLERVERFERLARRHFVGVKRGERRDHGTERGIALRRGGRRGTRGGKQR